MKSLFLFIISTTFLFSCNFNSKPDVGLEKKAEVDSQTNSPSRTAEPVTVKVVVVYQDPPIEAEGGKRLHEIFGFYDPFELNKIYIDSMEAVSHNTVNYEIVRVIDEDRMWTRFKDSAYLTKNRVYELLSDPNFTELKEREPWFDYKGFVEHYNFGELRDKDSIHEVWVWSWPVAGMWESQQVGQNAFWCNSNPLIMDNEKTLTIMGFNYERSADLAMHSFGHRAESVMKEVYGRWEANPPNPNNWELFTTLDIHEEGTGQVGNCHFPVNAEKDYEYGNQRKVKTYYNIWKYYPNLNLEEATAEVVDCSEWGCNQMGYMSWWYRKFPHFRGVNKEDKILNNWWHYIVDYEGAIALENNLKN